VCKREKERDHYRRRERDNYRERETDRESAKLGKIERERETHRAQSYQQKFSYLSNFH
jgi:hypothetical protein